MHIADLQDRRNGDSLAIYLIHPKPRYREAAALALASVQDTTASQHLAQLLLKDDQESVRKTAAFALGQTGGGTAAHALKEALNDSRSDVRKEILEALGKVMDVKDFNIIADYKPTDSLDETGQAWAFYRLGIRNLADSVISKKAGQFLRASKATSVRRAAAQYFARTNQVSGFHKADLINAALRDPDPEVRMAAARGLRHLPPQDALSTVLQILRQDTDYRVRCNAIRAMSKFTFVECKEALVDGLNDPNPNVVITASETIDNLLSVYDESLAKWSLNTSNWRAQANIFRALLAVDSNRRMCQVVKKKCKQAFSPYQQALLLEALSQDQASFDFIKEELMQASSPIVRTAAIQAMVQMNHLSANLNAQEKFMGIYETAVQQGDPVVMSIVATALADPQLGYKGKVRDINFLKEGRTRLKKPKDIEMIRPIDQAIAYFEDRKVNQSVQNVFNNPIDWELVKSIPRDQQVQVITNRGEFTMRLFVEETPGSVANFVKLSNEGYFDGKWIHRVVPNFVIQTGCNRGDGFGGEDFSIRSEFSMRRYRAGALGMASAGKDTEGTQWFITHSATPHLDGNYTLFGEVIEGLDTVHQLELGDQIIRVRLLNN